MGFLDNFPSEEVVIVRDEGTAEEARSQAGAIVQPAMGIFDLTASVYEGDIVEAHDPRDGGTRRLLVAEVRINNHGPQFDDVNNIEAVWAKAPARRVAPIQRVGLQDLHPEILAASSDLFTDEHYASAILEAFKALEIRVRRQSGLESSGQDLMAKAFDEKAPLINVAVEAGQSGVDEQRGCKFIFMGAIVGIRNPKAHEAIQQGDPQRALEYLAMASILMRRLDDAENNDG